MDIMISVRVSSDLKSTAVARIEEMLVHGLVADNQFVMSAVIMRPDPQGGSVGWGRIVPDEDTRQER